MVKYLQNNFMDYINEVWLLKQIMEFFAEMVFEHVTSRNVFKRSNHSINYIYYVTTKAYMYMKKALPDVYWPPTGRLFALLPTLIFYTKLHAFEQIIFFSLFPIMWMTKTYNNPSGRICFSQNECQEQRDKLPCLTT